MTNYLQIAKQFRAKKRLGQNFLVDEAVLNEIVQAAEPQEDETIIEIGPGLGFLTELLAQRAKKVVAVEIDPVAVSEVKALQKDNIEIIQKDVLKTDFSSLTDKPVKVVANLPYYITTPILVHLLGEVDELNNPNRPLISEMIIMVQKEVGQRILATEESKNKEWGSLSVLANYWTVPELVTEVKNKSFFPRPKVESVVLKLTCREKPAVEPMSPKHFRRVVKASFLFRRKKLTNALALSGFHKDVIDKAFQNSGIDVSIRGEKLSLEGYALLADCLYKAEQEQPA